MFFWDPTFILLVPALLLALWAQYKVKSTFNRYSRVQASCGMTGDQMARRLLESNGLSSVHIERAQGKLGDHYDPRSRVLRLSSQVAGSNSIAALGVAAHEVGHALQHQSGYGAFTVRQAVFPVASLGTTLAFPLFFIGFLFARSFSVLMDVGIIFFTGALFFQLVTLPVELNASSRGLKLLTERGYLIGKESSMAREVLRAAALTYIAAAAMAVTQLLRLLVLRGMRD